MFCLWIIIVQGSKTPLQLAQEDNVFDTKDEKVKTGKFLKSALQVVNNLFVIWYVIENT